MKRLHRLLDRLQLERAKLIGQVTAIELAEQPGSQADLFDQPSETADSH